LAIRLVLRPLRSCRAAPCAEARDRRTEALYPRQFPRFPARHVEALTAGLAFAPETIIRMRSRAKVLMLWHVWLRGPDNVGLGKIGGGRGRACDRRSNRCAAWRRRRTLCHRSGSGAGRTG